MNGRIRLAVWLKRILNVMIGAFVLVVVIALFASIGGLGGMLAGHKTASAIPLAIPVEFTLDPNLLSITAPQFGDSTLTMLKTSGVIVTGGARPVHQLAIGIALLVFGIVSIWEFQLFRRILLTVIRGEPFARANVWRIRWIGLLVIAWAVLIPAASYFWGRWTLPLVEAQGGDLQPAYSLNFGQLWIGLVIIVLAEVFRQGTSLEEDRSLTI